MRHESWRWCTYIDTAAAVVGLGLTQTQSGRALSGIFLIFNRCVAFIIGVGPHLRVVRELQRWIWPLGRPDWLLTFALLLFRHHRRPREILLVINDVLRLQD